MLLEVERKFLSVASALIANNAGDPPFSQLVSHAPRTFEDIYYDNGDTKTLRDAGIYVRQRNSTWQVKLKQGGTYNNSQFGEITDTAQIASLVQKTLKTNQDLSHTTFFGLRPCAQLRTTRLSWTADRAFNIVLDTTDFNHTVGEVELEEEVPHDISFEDKKAILKEMDSRIVEFMGKYSWAFRPGRPQGKLTAYFAMKKAAKKKETRWMEMSARAAP